MKRQYQQLIEEYLRFFPCVVLIGARQTGKSTLIQSLNENRIVYDLELRSDYDQIARDPDLFLRSNDEPIAIDEAQLLPSLFSALRVAIDRNRSNSGSYLLSGSSSPALLNSISESLAGRVGIIEIAPFSYSEVKHVNNSFILKLFNNKFEPMIKLKQQTKLTTSTDFLLINDYWFHGGYPEPWLKINDRFREIWKEQYLQTYVERDIARLFPQLNTVRFRRFIELLAGYSGSIMNYSNIAKILDVSQPTVKDYLRIAHGTFIWRTLPAYTKNVTKRVSKHPRGYFRDSGLLHHILQIPSHKKLLSHPQMGSSWEGLVIEEIIRALNTAGISFSAFYYRTSAGAEIDLILEGKFGLVPIEIKYTQTVATKQLRALRDFVEEFDCPFGLVVNNDEKTRQYDEKIYGIPFSDLFSESTE